MAENVEKRVETDLAPTGDRGRLAQVPCLVPEVSKGQADVWRWILSHPRSKEERRGVTPLPSRPNPQLGPTVPSLMDKAAKPDEHTSGVVGHGSGIRYNHWGDFSHVSHFSSKIPQRHSFVLYYWKKKNGKARLDKMSFLLTRDTGEREGAQGITGKCAWRAQKGLKSTQPFTGWMVSSCPPFLPLQGPIYRLAVGKDWPRKASPLLIIAIRPGKMTKRFCDTLPMTAAETFVEVGQTTPCSVRWFHMCQGAGRWRNCYHPVSSLSSPPVGSWGSAAKQLRIGGLVLKGM